MINLSVHCRSIDEQQLTFRELLPAIFRTKREKAWKICLLLLSGKSELRGGRETTSRIYQRLNVSRKILTFYAQR